MAFLRSFSILLMLIGLITITIGFTKTSISCPPPRVEYRYIPRKYLDEQLDNNNASEVMTDMVSDPSTYDKSIYSSGADSQLDYAPVSSK